LELKCDICGTAKNRLELVLVNDKLVCDTCFPLELEKLFNSIKSKEGQRMAEKGKKNETK